MKCETWPEDMHTPWPALCHCTWNDIPHILYVWYDDIYTYGNVHMHWELYKWRVDAVIRAVSVFIVIIPQLMLWPVYQRDCCLHASCLVGLAECLSIKYNHELQKHVGNGDRTGCLSSKWQTQLYAKKYLCSVTQHACNMIEAGGFQSTEILGKGNNVESLHIWDGSVHVDAGHGGRGHRGSTCPNDRPCDLLSLCWRTYCVLFCTSTTTDFHMFQF